MCSLERSAGATPHQLKHDAVVNSPSNGGAPTDEAAISFVAETRHQAADPVIARFRAALKSIQTSELQRLYDRLPELDDQSRLALSQFADQLQHAPPAAESFA